jgi:8-oxo-(d)GTP phosphatase
VTPPGTPSPPGGAVLLVRHAKAGSRGEWDGPDHRRPLSKKGKAQAARLAGQLGGRGVTRILSSPYTRCVQTVEPLAARLGLGVEESDALAEGAAEEDVAGLLASLAGETAVLCTHGDVIPTLLDRLARRDGLRLPPGYPCAKGSTWALHPDGGGRYTRAEYLPAP